MKNRDMIDRAAEASVRFLTRRGYELLDTSPEGVDVVAKDGDTIVFVRVLARSGADAGFPESDGVDRRSMEIAAARWLSAHPDEVDVPVRFDVIALLVLSGDRALVRYHINALADAADVPEA